MVEQRTFTGKGIEEILVPHYKNENKCTVQVFKDGVYIGQRKETDGEPTLRDNPLYTKKAPLQKQGSPLLKAALPKPAQKQVAPPQPILIEGPSEAYKEAAKAINQPILLYEGNSQ